MVEIRLWGFCSELIQAAPIQMLFFLTLFSSYQHKDIAKVELFTPGDKSIGELDFTKFRLIRNKGKPLKKVFMKQFEIPQGAGDGWYYAHVTMKDGSKYRAEDYVVVREMERATNAQPKDGAEDVPLPKKLTWNPIPGAKHYQVFLRDNWEGKTILESKLLSKPELVLPKNLIQPGGYYSWKIHSRDVNENVLLGDFNHGSLTRYMTFTVASE